MLNCEHSVEKRKHCGVKSLRPLQRCEMAHTPKQDQFRVRNAMSEIFRMFTFDKFVMLTLCDHDRHADLAKIARRIVGLRSLHQADGFNERLEVAGRGDKRG